MTTTPLERIFPTMKGQHQWVKHTITAVQIIADPTSDQPLIVEDTETEEVYGCDICDTPLNMETEQTPCPGKNTS